MNFKRKYYNKNVTLKVNECTCETDTASLVYLSCRPVTLFCDVPVKRAQDPAELGLPGLPL